MMFSMKLTTIVKLIALVISLSIIAVSYALEETKSMGLTTYLEIVFATGVGVYVLLRIIKNKE